MLQKIKIVQTETVRKENRQFESIFASDKDWQNNACVNWQHDPVEAYVIGYKDAGDKLAEFVIKNNRGQDTLVYPLVFLYRQYIELRLKEIIREGYLLLEHKGTFPKHHKILNLWETAKGIALEIAKDIEPPPDLSYAEYVITDFAKIDPDSFSFRYPTTKKGEITIDRRIKHINIRRLANHINDLSAYLDGISFEISVCLDHKFEMDGFLK